MKNQKLLVGFLSSITKKQVFIFVWLFVGALFTFLILNFYKRSTQRNFKEEPFPRKPKSGGGKDLVSSKVGSNVSTTEKGTGVSNGNKNS